MPYKTILQFVQSIINSVQNTGIYIVKNLQQLQGKTYNVKVINPQEKVIVTGKVEVDQTKVIAQVRNTTSAIRTLRETVKTLKEVSIKNFPAYPKFPEIKFPTTIGINNLPKETKISNFQELSGDFTKLREAVERLKIVPKVEVKSPTVTVKAPIVNVPEQPRPIVNVLPPDLSKLTEIIEFFNNLGVKNPLPVRLSDGKRFYNALEKMAEIYAGSSFSAFQDSTGQDARAMINRDHNLQVVSAEKWITSDVYTSGEYTYICEETRDSEWRIKRIISGAEYTPMRFATPVNNPTITSYGQAVADYVNLEYGRISEV